MIILIKDCSYGELHSSTVMEVDVLANLCAEGTNFTIVVGKLIAFSSAKEESQLNCVLGKKLKKEKRKSTSRKYFRSDFTFALSKSTRKFRTSPPLFSDTLEWKRLELTSSFTWEMDFSLPLDSIGLLRQGLV